MSFARNKRASDKGFSLFECIVALGVFSLVAMSSLTLVTQTMRSSTVLEERLSASFVAENVMVETRLLRQLNVSAQTGEYDMGGLSFEYERVVTDTDQATLKQIEIKVRLAGQTQVLAQLIGFWNAPVITT